MTTLEVRSTPAAADVVTSRSRSRRVPVSAIALVFLVAFLLVPLVAVVDSDDRVGVPQHDAVVTAELAAPVLQEVQS